MKIAVAILNYKRHDLALDMSLQLRDCPHPVYCFNQDGEIEPIPGLIIIRRKENGYFVGGWNWTMDYLSKDFDYVWMCNDDITGLSWWNAGHLADRFSMGVKFGAITPAFNSPHAEFHHRPEKMILRTSKWVDWTCPMVSMEAWLDVGPFDKNLKGYGADIDWCYRARKKGWVMAVDHSLKIHHLGSQTATSQGLQGIQGDVAGMNKYLCEKWGVDTWTRLVV